MFGSIIYRTNHQTSTIDVGAIAEGLIFYERVLILGNRGDIARLFKKIPPFILLELLRDGRLEFHYQESQLAVSHKNFGAHVEYSLVSLSAEKFRFEIAVPEEFLGAAGNTTQARFGARQFTNKVQVLDVAGFDQTSFFDILLNEVGTTKAASTIVRMLAPNYSQEDPIFFKVHGAPNCFFVDTNIDFDRLNSVSQKISGSTTLTSGLCLVMIQNAFEHAYHSASLNSELAVTEFESTIQSSILSTIVAEHSRNRTEIANFTELVLSDANTIRDAVNSGAVPFSKILSLLSSADKFRHWIRDQPADARLLNAYHKEVMKESWAEKLPGKSTRWMLFTGAGALIDTVGGGGGRWNHRDHCIEPIRFVHLR